MTYDDIDNQRASPEKDRKNKKQTKWRLDGIDLNLPFKTSFLSPSLSVIITV